MLAIANVAAFGVTAIGNIAAGWLGEGVERVLKTGVFGPVTGEAAKEIGTHTAVAGLSAVLLIAGIVMLIWRVPEVDGIKPGDAGYGPPRRNLWDGLTARAHRPRKTEAAPTKPSAWEPETSHAGAK